MAKSISFTVSKEDAAIILEIARRAWKISGNKYDLLDAGMDITATHANGCPLKLAELLAADDFNFIHDVFGIRRHLNRETGELMDCFSPRFHA